MVGLLSLWRLSRYRWGDLAVAEDPFAAILVSFPLTLVWSLIYYQGSPDFYWFLPSIAIGFGKFLDLAVGAVEASRDVARPAELGRALTLGVSVVLIVLAMLNALAARESGLDDQMRASAEIERRFFEGRPTADHRRARNPRPAAAGKSHPAYPASLWVRQADPGDDAGRIGGVGCGTGGVPPGSRRAPPIEGSAHG